MPQQEGQGDLRTLLPSFVLSTKDVHGMWVTMWISMQ
jgi:hypothetical protein